MWLIQKYDSKLCFAVLDPIISGKEARLGHHTMPMLSAKAELKQCDVSDSRQEIIVSYSVFISSRVVPIPWCWPHLNFAMLKKTFLEVIFDWFRFLILCYISLDYANDWRNVDTSKCIHGNLNDLTSLKIKKKKVSIIGQLSAPIFRILYRAQTYKH